MTPRRYLETDYVRSFCKRSALCLPDLRLFRRNVGQVPIPGTTRRFIAALPGQCDLYGLTRGGRHLEIECKRFTDLSSDQEQWRDWCAEWRIPWMLLEVHRGELPSVTIERWCDEVGEKLREMC